MGAVRREQSLMEWWGIGSQVYLSLEYAVMFGFDNTADHIHRMIELKIVIDDHIIECFEAVEFLACRCDTDGQLVGCLRLAFLQSADKFVFALGRDEY